MAERQVLKAGVNYEPDLSRAFISRDRALRENEYRRSINEQAAQAFAEWQARARQEREHQQEQSKQIMDMLQGYVQPNTAPATTTGTQPANVLAQPLQSQPQQTPQPQVNPLANQSSWIALNDKAKQLISSGQVSDADMQRLSSEPFYRYALNTKGLTPSAVDKMNRVELTADLIRPYAEEYRSLYNASSPTLMSDDKLEELVNKKVAKLGAFDDNPSLFSSPLKDLADVGVSLGIGAADTVALAGSLGSGVLGVDNYAGELAKGFAENIKNDYRSDWQNEARAYASKLIDEGRWRDWRRFVTSNPSVLVNTTAEILGPTLGWGAAAKGVAKIGTKTLAKKGAGIFAKTAGKATQGVGKALEKPLAAGAGLGAIQTGGSIADAAYEANGGVPLTDDQRKNILAGTAIGGAIGAIVPGTVEKGATNLISGAIGRNLNNAAKSAVKSTLTESGDVLARKLPSNGITAGLGRTVGAGVRSAASEAVEESVQSGAEGYYSFLNTADAEYRSLLQDRIDSGELTYDQAMAEYENRDNDPLWQGAKKRALEVAADSAEKGAIAGAVLGGVLGGGLHIAGGLVSPDNSINQLNNKAATLHDNYRKAASTVENLQRDMGLTDAEASQLSTQYEYMKDVLDKHLSDRNTPIDPNIIDAQVSEISRLNDVINERRKATAEQENETADAAEQTSEQASAEQAAYDAWVKDLNAAEILFGANNEKEFNSRVASLQKQVFNDARKNNISNDTLTKFASEVEASKARISNQLNEGQTADMYNAVMNLVRDNAMNLRTMDDYTLIQEKAAELQNLNEEYRAAVNNNLNTPQQTKQIMERIRATSKELNTMVDTVLQAQALLKKEADAEASRAVEAQQRQEKLTDTAKNTATDYAVKSSYQSLTPGQQKMVAAGNYTASPDQVRNYISGRKKALGIPDSEFASVRAEIENNSKVTSDLLLDGLTLQAFEELAPGKGKKGIVFPTHIAKGIEAYVSAPSNVNAHKFNQYSNFTPQQLGEINNAVMLIARSVDNGSLLGVLTKHNPTNDPLVYVSAFDTSLDTLGKMSNKDVQWLQEVAAALINNDPALLPKMPASLKSAKAGVVNNSGVGQSANPPSQRAEIGQAGVVPQSASKAGLASPALKAAVKKAITNDYNHLARHLGADDAALTAAYDQRSKPVASPITQLMASGIVGKAMSSLSDRYIGLHKKYTDLNSLQSMNKYKNAMEQASEDIIAQLEPFIRVWESHGVTLDLLKSHNIAPQDYVNLKSSIDEIDANSSEAEVSAHLAVMSSAFDMYYKARNMRGSIRSNSQNQTYNSAALTGSLLGRNVKEILMVDGTKAALKYLRGQYNHDPRMQRIIDRLIKLPDVKVVFDASLSQQDKRIMGQYNAMTDTVLLNPMSDQTDIDLVHELVHAYTSWAFANRTSLSKGTQAIIDNIDATYQYIRNHADFAGRPEVANLDEFVAEFMSNPMLRAEMERVLPPPDGKKLLTKVRDLLRSIGELLGLVEPLDMDALIDSTASVMRTRNHLGGDKRNLKNPGVLNREKTVYDHYEFAADFGLNRYGEQILGSAYRDQTTGLWHGRFFEMNGDINTSAINGIAEADMMKVLADNKLAIKHRSKKSGSKSMFDNKVDRIHMVNPVLGKFLIHLANTSEGGHRLANKFGDFIMTWVGHTQSRDGFITFAQRLAEEKWKGNTGQIRDVVSDITAMRAKIKAELTSHGINEKSVYDYRNDLKKLMEKYGMSANFVSEALYYLRAQELKKTKADQISKGFAVAGFGEFYSGKRGYDDLGDIWYSQRSIEEKQRIQDLKNLFIQRNNRLLQAEFQAGIISKEAYDKWKNEFYVPLKDEKLPLSVAKVRQKGRYSAAQDPWLRYEMEEEMRFRNIERNSINAEFANFITEYQLNEIAVVNRQTATQTQSQYSYKYMADAFLDGVSLTYYRDGERYNATFTDPHLKKVLHDLRKQSDSAGHWFIRAITDATRFISLVRTSFSPSFSVLQFARDLIASSINSQGAFNRQVGRPMVSDAEAAKLSARIPVEAVMALTSTFRSKLSNSGSWQYDLFKSFGGGIALTARFDIGSTRARLRAYDPNQPALSKFKNMLGKGVDGLLHISHAFDEAVRFAAWKSFLEMKYGRAFTSKNEMLNFLQNNQELAKAAIVGSKHITGNFEEKGGNVYARGMYSFFNSAMVGARTAGHAVNPKYGTHGIKMASLLMAVAAYAVSGMMDDLGDDPDGRNKVQRIRATKDAICAGDVCYPVPHEFRWATGIGRAAALLLKDDKYTEGDAFKDIAYGIAQGYNPLPFGDFADDPAIATLQGLTPTIALPFVEHGLNINSLGTQLRPDRVYDDEGKLITNPMDWQVAKASTPQAYREAAAFMYKNFGFDMSPTTMQHFTEFFLGGIASNTKAFSKQVTEQKGDYFTAGVNTLFRGFTSSYDEYALRTAYEKKLQVLLNSSRMGEGGNTLAASQSGLTYHKANVVKEAVDKAIRALSTSTASKADIIAAEKYAMNQNPPDYALLERINKVKTALTQAQNTIYGNAIRILEEMENER